MAQNLITNGENGLSVRNDINNNFTELYTFALSTNKFQPAGQVYPEPRALLVSDLRYGTGLTYRQSATTYIGGNFAFYYENGRWFFMFDDGDGMDEQIQATTTGGTYPWSVVYNNDSGGNAFLVQEYFEPVPRVVGSNLAVTASEGTSIYAAKADHVHPLPSALADLPIYATNSAAVSGGLTVNKIYKTSTGELRIVI